MGYRTLRHCLQDLEAHGQLVRLDQEVDPDLEAACIVRRVHRAGGPAVLFTRVKGCRFPMVGNLFGTRGRVRFLFRDTWKRLTRLLELKVDPLDLLRRPWRYRALPRVLWDAFPRPAARAPVLAHRIALADLPRVRSWPQDGGAFITLPAVYTEDPERPGWRRSNLGMYRVQLDGGEYRPGEEVGLHYQIHRGIGVHHAAALRRGEPLRVNVAVGGPPSLALAAVMPLPEGVPEIAFAGALGGHPVSLCRAPNGLAAPAQADFLLSGTVEAGRLLPEGPFGDHLGYYSLAHPFPVMRVESVSHRPAAVWPFTTVGRPPQEDTVLGELIHELVGPVIPSVLPGVHAVHAVDAAGVHPLLLAVGSERYTPYRERTRPQEVLTQACAILGHGQLSLAKYLLIAAREDDPPPVRDIPAFFRHVLERLDLGRDLHFHTETTIDTLDYSGPALHRGSKVVMAAVGPPRRRLCRRLPAELVLPEGFTDPRLCLPGVAVVQGPRYRSPEDPRLEEFRAPESLPLVVVVDDSSFAASSLENFLWVTFTRSDPAPDLHGRGARVRHKHWGCAGPLVIDARLKPHHAPPLEEDPEVVRRVEALGAKGGPLHGIL